ncbi:MAG: imidazoleglycerol-phosphate dehydratase [Candidatus Omnitrophica bacterium]|nr:imidazoleglycerol-phosphate dehydratase [Candidatus Omnitrophota bacterium]
MREASRTRESKETNITVKLNIDGSGESKINSGIGFLDHMLELFAFWGHFDLEVTTKEADFKVDIHHANEDLGIVLGQVFKMALGDKKGINRIGDASVPMEDVTANVAVDISGRGHLKISYGTSVFVSKTQEGYLLLDANHFFESLAKHLGMNLNIAVNNPNEDLHTTLEPVFKGLGIALDQATQIDPRRKGIPSTKGVID